MRQMLDVAPVTSVSWQTQPHTAHISLICTTMVAAGKTGPDKRGDGSWVEFFFFFFANIGSFYPASHPPFAHRLAHCLRCYYISAWNKRLLPLSAGDNPRESAGPCSRAGSRPACWDGAFGRHP